MGTLWNRSGTIERFADDLRAGGAQAHFFSGGTTTPLVVFRDSAEQSAFPDPVVADANGRWPDVFVPYVDSYDVQVLTAEGVQLTFSIKIPNPNPVVDITTTIPPEIAERLVQTGMVHARFLTNQVVTGYVRLNGRTIGNANSQGTEMNDEKAKDLFIYLYNNISNALAPVLPARSVPADGLTDFNLGKVITLPDCRGRVLIGADEMGSSSAGVFPFPAILFDSGGNATAGSTTGINGKSLALENMPPHQHTGGTHQDGSHVHIVDSFVATTDVEPGPSGTGHVHSYSGSVTWPPGQSINHTHFMASAGSGTTVAASGGLGATLVSNTGRVSSADVASDALEHTHNYGGTTGSSPHAHSITIPLQVTRGITDVNSPFYGHIHTYTTDFMGGVSGVVVAFNNLPRSMLVAWYIKL